MRNFKEARSLRAHMKVHLKGKDDIQKEIDTNLKEKLQPQYNEINPEGELISTMISEDLNKACRIEDLIEQKLSKTTTGEKHSNKIKDELKPSLVSTIAPLDSNPLIGKTCKQFLGQNPIVLPMSKYFNQLQELSKYLYFNQNMRLNMEFKNSRKQALEHLSNQIIFDFI